MLTFCVGLGIAPTEFWDMTLPEFLTIFEAFRPAGGDAYAGSLTRADIDELRAMDD